MSKQKWICTDPDSNQYGRKVPNQEGVYEFKVLDKKGVEIIKKEKVDLGEWKLKKVEDVINSYGYTLHKKNAGKNGDQYIYDTVDDVDWIIAECIFETEL